MDLKEIEYVSNIFISSEICSEKEVPSSRINIDKFPAYISIKTKEEKPVIKSGTLLLSLVKSEVDAICSIFTKSPYPADITVNMEGEEVGIAGTTIKVPAVVVTRTILSTYDKLSEEKKNKLKELGWLELELRRVQAPTIFERIIDKNFTSKMASISYVGFLVPMGDTVL